ncbi:MAG: 4-(cytidine 5'-diphospho)-2-C-methyl-D-erythritol kinase [Thermodesulfovibrionales bacterium]
MLTLNAPAKINWFLSVFGKRKDGYHEIQSLMQYVTLSDSIGFEYSDDIEVVTDADIPLEDNLVYKAAVLLKKATGSGAGVRVTLKKEIPLSAGLGGGSSDAAFTLLGLNQLWNLNLTGEELIRLGARLGSDVPFFFNGPAALVEGRGDIVSAVRLNRPYTILLVKPLIGVSSSWAYAELDRFPRQEVLTKGDNNIKLFCQALEKGDFSLLSSILRNDLEPFVIKRYPVIGDIKHTLMFKGARFSSMSGSGPTVFGVFETEEKARKAMEHMSPNWCRIVNTVA